MYNIGLVRFIEAKSLKSKQCIDAFLKHQGVAFTSKNHNRVNDYIDKNWNRFATFVDKGIRAGTLNGNPVKLNTYYAEQEERRNIVASEFDNEELSGEEKWILTYIGKHGVGNVQSYLSKVQKQHSPAKDYSYTSKKLQWLPLVKMIENKQQLIDFLKEKLKKQQTVQGRDTTDDYSSNTAK
jgi:hypothetical protein